MNNYDYILKLLNFQDKNIEIIKIYFFNNNYYIYVIFDFPKICDDKSLGITLK